MFHSDKGLIKAHGLAPHTAWQCGIIITYFVYHIKRLQFDTYTAYGSLPKISNTLNIRTPKIIAKYNFKMFPKISNSG